MSVCRSSAGRLQTDLIKEAAQKCPTCKGGFCRSSTVFQIVHTTPISLWPRLVQPSRWRLPPKLLTGKLGGRKHDKVKPVLGGTHLVQIGPHSQGLVRLAGQEARGKKVLTTFLTPTLTSPLTTTHTNVFRHRLGTYERCTVLGRGLFAGDQHCTHSSSKQEKVLGAQQVSLNAKPAQLGTEKTKSGQEHVHTKKILCLSNGHGEDAIAVAILKALQTLAAECGEPLTIEALPLVGLGGAYTRGGISTIGPAQTMPSGGFLYMDRKQIVGDVRAGLLTLTWQQWTALTRWTRSAGANGTLLAVGDVLPLAMTWLASKYEKARGPHCRKGLPVKYAFVGTAKSEFYVRGLDGTKLAPEKRDAVEKLLSPDCVYLPWERALLSADECAFTAPRDGLTGQVLRTHLSDGVKRRVLDLGNPMMDDIELAGRPEALSAGFEGFRRVAIVPGSRPPEVHRNFEMLLAAADAIAQSAPAERFLFLAPIVPSLDVRPFVDALNRRGWSRAVPEPPGVGGGREAPDEAHGSASVGASGSGRVGVRTVGEPEKPFVGTSSHERDPVWSGHVTAECMGPGEALAGASDRTDGYLEDVGARGKREAPKKALASGVLGRAHETQTVGQNSGTSRERLDSQLPGETNRKQVRSSSQDNQDQLQQTGSTTNADGETSLSSADTAGLGHSRQTRQTGESLLSPSRSRHVTDHASGHSAALEERTPGDCWPEPLGGPVPTIAFTKDGGKLAVLLVRGAFAECAHQAEAGLAMAGTATEQMVGLGKPVFTVPGGGPQFTFAFAEAQSRLLGDSVILCPSAAAVGPAFQEVLSDARRVAAIRDNGLRRMGDAGASARLAEAIWERLLTT